MGQAKSVVFNDYKQWEQGSELSTVTFLCLGRYVGGELGAWVVGRFQYRRHLLGGIMKQIQMMIFFFVDRSSSVNLVN